MFRTNDENTNLKIQEANAISTRGRLVSKAPISEAESISDIKDLKVPFVEVTNDPSIFQTLRFPGNSDELIKLTFPSLELSGNEPTLYEDITISGNNSEILDV